MSLGCLAGDRPRRMLMDTPAILLGALLLGQFVGIAREQLEGVVSVGNQVSPELVFFGAEAAGTDPTNLIVPIEAIEGLFFALVALVMIGPGQELGRALNRVPNRIAAYSLNIAGSLAGIGLFAACSWLELAPVWWFALIAIGLGYVLTSHGKVRLRGDVVPVLASLIAIASWTSGVLTPRNSVADTHWSPYYRVDYLKALGAFSVNLIGFQQMVSRDDDAKPAHAYAVPYLLRRDVGGPPFENVLVIGAGSGNDVSRALAWGARHVDAVEIDPVILRIGRRDHPDRPYDDPRVTTHVGDGRNFLRVAEGSYDLILFALVDSLVLHSGHSNLRLESFTFTREAFEDVRRLLAPNGVFVMYNLFRQGWIVERLSDSLQQTFGGAPLVMTLPYRDRIRSDTAGGFTILLAGHIEPIRDAFRREPEYRVAADTAMSPTVPAGFGDVIADEGSLRLGLADIVDRESLTPATDDWPFLYLREPMIPGLSLRGIVVMGAVALIMFLVFMRGAGSAAWRIDGRMFFLGAGFMLVETKAVVHMALIFGSTWMVNTFVFAGVLVMILGANLYAARTRPASLTPYYWALFAALALNVVVPLDSFLGWPRVWQTLGAGMLVFAPILFAGVIFAVSFSRSLEPNRDFGANVAGAMFGGLAENCSMLLGFQYLTLVIIGCYALSSMFGRSIRPSAVSMQQG
jgi:SAM-dependent methyltransferase